MIELLTVWVKTIVFVVLFATFLEFLLPNSSMQRFVRVIMGLFILLTVLNPVVDLIHNKWPINNVTATAGKSADYSAVLNANQNLVQERERLAMEIYKSDIAKQAKALITVIEGVADAKIVVNLDEKREKNLLGGKIKKLEVYVQPGLVKNNEKVTKVKIGYSTSNVPQEIKPELAGRIKKTLCEFYQLQNEQVTVNLSNVN